MCRDEEIEMWIRATDGKLQRSAIERIVDRVSPRIERNEKRRQEWQGWKIVRITDRQEYLDYLQSDEWGDVKSMVWSRDGGECRDCCSCDFLQVHHLSYRYLGKEWMDDFRSVILLCKWCHRDRHRKRLN